MSQLDFSINFTHFLGFLLCFYIFTHYFSILLVKFWYMKKLRSLSEKELVNDFEKISDSTIIKKVLKL